MGEGDVEEDGEEEEEGEIEEDGKEDMDVEGVGDREDRKDGLALNWNVGFIEELTDDDTDTLLLRDTDSVGVRLGDAPMLNEGVDETLVEEERDLLLLIDKEGVLDRDNDGVAECVLVAVEVDVEVLVAVEVDVEVLVPVEVDVEVLVPVEVDVEVLVSERLGEEEADLVELALALVLGDAVAVGVGGTTNVYVTYATFE